MMKTTVQPTPHKALACVDISLIPYILATIVLIALPLFVSAQETLPPHPLGCKDFKAMPLHDNALAPLPGGMPAMQQLSPFDDLGLTDEQQEKVFMLMYAQAPTIFEKEKIVRKTMEALHQLAMSGNFDAVKAKALADVHGKALADLVYLHTATQAAIRNILTEAQRKRMDEQTERQ